MIATSGIYDPNVRYLDKVVGLLGDLHRQLVFVGGCATGLLITGVQSQIIRPTQDVDAIASVTSLQDFHALESRLLGHGFGPDKSEHAPLGRWLVGTVKLDIMPSVPVTGYFNQWFPMACQTANQYVLPSGATIALISSPVFVATKIDAFRGRGQGDFQISHDIEDIVTVVDGRKEIVDEISNSSEALRTYISAEIRGFLKDPRFIDALSGHLPGDAASQARRSIVIDRLRQISE